MVKKLQWIWGITAFRQVLIFANFHDFHNIPYANGLQFAKLFYHQSILITVQYMHFFEM